MKAPYRVTKSMYRIAVALNTKSLTCAELADAVNVAEKNDIRRVIKRMEEDGYITTTRKQTPSRKMAMVYHATPLMRRLEAHFSGGDFSLVAQSCWSATRLAASTPRRAEVWPGVRYLIEAPARALHVAARY